jgi:pilus assembly protein CpaE
MPATLSVAIIDHDKVFRNALTSALMRYPGTIVMAGSADNFGDGMMMIHTCPPDVVFLGVGDLRQGVEAVQSLTKRYPRMPIITVACQNNPEWILALMGSGAAGYLLHPFSKEDLHLTLQKVARFLVTPATRALPATGNIISVYHPIGGTGTTTVAVNLAAALATGAAKVALVDLNLEAGDIGTFLNITPSYNLSSLTKNIERLDNHFLMSVMARHSSGPFVLTDAPEFDENLTITPDRVQRILNLMKGIFDYSIVDCVGPFAGCNVPILQSSSLILFTTTGDKPSLNSIKRNLIRLEHKGIQPDTVKLVVNRFIPDLDPLARDATDMIGHPLFQVIPEEYQDVVDSINKGMPVVKLLPHSRVSVAIMGLARNVELALNTKGWLMSKAR